MNILISNDDGIDAEGIKVLYERLCREHNVYVVAPDSNRSAVSHHISMFKPTKITKIDDRHYTCSGFPADCVGIGLNSDLFDVKFDVVLSGINMGPNLGTDIVYSGTCAGARQAVFDNVPGIALSVEPFDWSKPLKYEAMADFVAKNLNSLIPLASVQNPRIFVNVNGASLDSYKGVVFGNKLCSRIYNDRMRVTPKDNAFESNMIPGNGVNVYPPETDHSIVHNEYVCVNRVYADPVCADTVEGVTFKL